MRFTDEEVTAMMMVLLKHQSSIREADEGLDPAWLVRPFRKWPRGKDHLDRAVYLYQLLGSRFTLESWGLYNVHTTCSNTWPFIATDKSYFWLATVCSHYYTHHRLHFSDPLQEFSLTRFSFVFLFHLITLLNEPPCYVRVGIMGRKNEINGSLMNGWDD